jgi:hypothetical protein
MKAQVKSGMWYRSAKQPAAIENRAVTGNWVGDLIAGSKNSGIEVKIWPTINALPWLLISMCLFLIHKAPGSVAQMRTPNGC